MIQSLFNNSKKKELPFIFAYGAFAFFIGLFLTYYDVIVHSLFFIHFGYKYFATTFILGGTTGVILTYLFSLVYKRINTKVLSFIVISTILVFSITYLVLQILLDNKWIEFSGMVLFFPINILVIITLWRYGRKLLFPFQTRYIFPKVKLMLFSGIAIGGISITLLLYKYQFTVLLICAICLAILLWLSILFLNIIYKKSRSLHKTEEKYIPIRRSFLLFFTSKYTTYLFLFTCLSAIVGFSIHFAFINVSWVNFRNIVGMSKFYGLFTFILLVFIFGIDRFLIKRILYSYDSPYSIVIIPLLVIVSLLIALLSNLILGNFLKREHFTLFFLLVIICKVGYITSLQTIQMPSLQVLFQSLDLRYKQLAYPRVEGTMIMTGLLVAGIFILGLSYLKFYSITIVIAFAIFVSIAWFWFSFKLIKAYQKTQEKELTKHRFKRSEEDHDDRIEERIRRILVKDEDEKIIETLKITARIRPFEYENDLVRLLAHPSPKVKSYIIDCILSERVVSAIPELKSKLTEISPDEKEKYTAAILNLERLNSIKITENLVREKIYSGSIEDRIDFTYALSNSKFPEKESILIALTKDYDSVVQNAAIKALARIDSGDYCYSLIEYLYPGRYNACAFDAIAASRDKAVDFLERESSIPGIDDITLSRIIKLYGKIGTSTAVELLLSKMGEIDNHVLMHSIQALVDNRFQAGNEHKYKIINHIVKITSFIAYNLYTYKVLSANKKYDLLLQAYSNELRINYNQLFKLLTLLYNANIISALEKIFMRGSRAEISHGIELADQYIDEDIKPIIFPLFEDISIEEKIKKLEYYFPQQKVSFQEILSATLTYDFNALSLYPRACAIFLIDKFGLEGFEDELIFCANHPDQLLGETALFVINKRNPALAQSILKINSKSVARFYGIPTDPNNLLFMRFKELIQFPAFNLLSEYVAIELTKSAKVYYLAEGESIILNKSLAGSSLLLTMASLSIDRTSKMIHYTNHFIPIELLKSLGIHELQTRTKCVIWAFKTDTVDELLYDNIDLSNAVLSAIDNLQITD
jgi:ATP:ADP antiporter, AAA family